MLLFCPACSNLLTISRSSSSSAAAVDSNITDDLQNRFACTTCPYEFPLTQTYFERQTTRQPTHNITDTDADEQAAGEAGDGGVMDRADAPCPREGCDSSEALFYQMQIRSADEPMTTFFRCVKCGERWREG